MTERGRRVENGFHENNKEFKEKKEKLHHREADWMLRSLTTGKNSKYNYTNTTMRAHRAPRTELF